MNQRIKVKVCGTTRAADARIAVGLGVDAIGMILHADSPRLIDTNTAIDIRQEVPALVSLVGVFVDASQAFIRQAVEDIGLDLVQLHGAESNEFGRSLGVGFIKAIRAKERTQVASQLTQYPDARALLFDPYVKGQPGGTGQRLDADLWPRESKQKLILAGGLSPENVADACNSMSPYAVDLNSGVESAPGIKDHQRLEQALLAIGR
ncbi:MAG: phosphoribosylanthranilate isomerase [Pseudomonadota bacterium]